MEEDTFENWSPNVEKLVTLTAADMAWIDGMVKMKWYVGKQFGWAERTLVSLEVYDTFDAKPLVKGHAYPA